MKSLEPKFSNVASFYGKALVDMWVGLCLIKGHISK